MTGVQTGTVLAYLSGKVLGQYEVFSADPGQLLLVAPNIVEAERKLEGYPRLPAVGLPARGDPPDPVHRGALAARPLPGRGGGLRGRRPAPATCSSSAPGGRVWALADAVRNPDSRVSVIDIVQTPAQRVVLDRITALMTLLEGHAEFVMDGVGPEVVPAVERSGPGSTAGARRPTR